MKAREIIFRLKNYQKDAHTGINRIFKRPDWTNRFASTILSTGGGKSFIAIAQLLTFGKENEEIQTSNNGQEINIKADENGCINDKKMVYLASTNPILDQVKLHIVKYVLLNNPDLDKMTIEQIDSFVSNNLDGRKFTGINSDLDYKDQISDDASVQEKRNAILRHLSSQDIDKLVKDAFPNLTFGCYAGVSEKSELGDAIENADLIIVDEAHRLGAKKWGANFFERLKMNVKAKVMAITATPDRTDKQKKDIMAVIAKHIYGGHSIDSKESTVLPQEYIAQEVYVVDAMRNGMVVSPNKVMPNAVLAKTDEYLETKYRYEREKIANPDSDETKELEKILIEMDKIIGFDARNLSEKEIDDEVNNEIGETIKNNIPNVNGKYIAFLPPNKENSGAKKVDSAEYYNLWMDKIRNQFKEVKDENGNPVKISFSIVTSNKEIMLDDNGNAVIPDKDEDKSKYHRLDASQTLMDFENESSESGGIKIVLSIDMLNEGVHIDGIDGAIMYRPTESSTVFLQQTGRCIYAMDENLPQEDHKKITIIDACGNSFDEALKGTGRKTSVDFDLKKIQEIEKWLESHENILPNINQQGENKQQQVEAEKEVRLAIEIKRLKEKYELYYGKSLTVVKDRDKIEKILEIADQIKLWDSNIPKRTVEPSEEELTGESFLSLTEDQKRFLELYNQVKSKTKEVLPRTRLNKLMNIVRILRMYDPNIEFPEGVSISIQTKDGEKSYDDFKSTPFEKFLEEKFTDIKTRQKILISLRNEDLIGTSRYEETYHEGEEYDIGLEIAYVRGLIYTSQKEFKKSNFESKLFDNYELSDFYGLGVIKSFKDDYKRIVDLNNRASKDLKNVERKYILPENIQDMETGRLIRPKSGSTFMSPIEFGLIDKFEDCDVFGNGYRYVNGLDRDGYDEEGYNVEGYNKFGFNREGIHRDTGTIFDCRGFYYDENAEKYLNMYTLEEYDLLGYNIYDMDKDGFERPTGPERTRNGTVIYRKPKWRFLIRDGAYSIYGYDTEQGKQGARDANSFTSEDKNDNPSIDKRFFRNGATKKKPTLGMYDFYVNRIRYKWF